jgi:hypothetical protein
MTGSIERMLNNVISPAVISNITYGAYKSKDMNLGYQWMNELNEAPIIYTFKTCLDWKDMMKLGC